MDKRQEHFKKTIAPIFAKKPRTALFAHPNNQNSSNTDFSPGFSAGPMPQTRPNSSLNFGQSSSINKSARTNPTNNQHSKFQSLNQRPGNNFESTYNGQRFNNIRSQENQNALSTSKAGSAFGKASVQQQALGNNTNKRPWSGKNSPGPNKSNASCGANYFQGSVGQGDCSFSDVFQGNNTGQCDNFHGKVNQSMCFQGNTNQSNRFQGNVNQGSNNVQGNNEHHKNAIQNNNSTSGINGNFGGFHDPCMDVALVNPSSLTSNESSYGEAPAAAQGGWGDMSGPPQGQAALGEPFTPKQLEAQNNKHYNTTPSRQSSNIQSDEVTGSNQSTNINTKIQNEDDSMRMLCATVQGMTYWSQNNKKSTALMFEIIGKLNSAVSGNHGISCRDFTMLDDKGASVKCIFYEIDRQCPRLIRGQYYRCVGTYNSGQKALNCVNIHPASEQDRCLHPVFVAHSDKEMRVFTKA